MKFVAREVLLKNGKTVLLREATPEDAALILDCIRVFIPASEFIPKLDSEILATVEDVKAWLQKFYESSNSIMILAEYDGRSLGHIDFLGQQRKIMQHTAVVGMGLLPKWQNSGLGSALMAAALEWARQHPVLEIIWLQLYTENAAALQLYRKFGFKDCGLIPGFFYQNGHYYDQLTMALNVK